jgi:hypothetical protein
LALLFSFIFSLFFIYIFPEEKYSIYLFNRKKKKNKRKNKEIAAHTIWNKLPSTSQTNTLNKNKVKTETNHQYSDDKQPHPNGNIKNILK